MYGRYYFIAIAIIQFKYLDIQLSMNGILYTFFIQ